jgi:Protein of unknown function (DUF3313)
MTNRSTRVVAPGRNNFVRILPLSRLGKLAKGLVAAPLVACLAVLAGCATGSQARKTEASGFLGEYKSLLQPGKPGEEELLVYKNPETNWAGYKKILLEPVTIWTDPKWKLSSEERKDLQKLVDSFQATLQKKLSADYELVDQAGTGVLRVQVALTGGKKAIMILKVASKGVPYGSGASYLWTFITGKPPFVGEASIEFMVKDGETDKLLAAGADRRVGADTIVAGKTVNTQYLNSWGDVKYSLDYWSDEVVYRLCVLREGTNCVAPKKGLKVPTPK